MPIQPEHRKLERRENAPTNKMIDVKKVEEKIKFKHVPVKKTVYVEKEEVEYYDKEYVVYD